MNNSGPTTYIRSSNGWLYLAVVLDLYSRRVIGWSLADHMRADLVCDALKKAIATRSRTRGVTFHSDRGSQYGSRKFRKLLKNFKMLQSMSARANPYENAWTESFIGTMKKEMDPLNYKQNPQKLRLQCFRYKEDYYNTQIKHSSLGYYSIPKFESIHALY